VGLYSAILAALIFVLLTFSFSSITYFKTSSSVKAQEELLIKKDDVCRTMKEVEESVQLGKCWVVYNDEIFDVTDGEKWSVAGHFEHFCGKKYDQKAIENGPHGVSVLDDFRLAPLCGNSEAEIDQNVIKNTETSIKEEVSKDEEFYWRIEKPLGLKGWRVLFAYLSGIFFILNFATCYAMPWARIRIPWGGKQRGRDKNESVGKYPLTYWHSWFAWGAVFSFTVHAVLGFLCLWGVVCL
jgi:predicted heme/steroid binding protein